MDTLHHGFLFPQSIQKFNGNMAQLMALARRFQGSVQEQGWPMGSHDWPQIMTWGILSTYKKDQVTNKGNEKYTALNNLLFHPARNSVNCHKSHSGSQPKPTVGNQNNQPVHMVTVHVSISKQR